MQRYLCIPAILLLAGLAHANGLLIPVEPDLPPLAMLNHHVGVTIEDQVAVTRVRQTFRNHTERPLEATYVFPVPKGASVRDFAMWLNGQRVKANLLPADEAKSTYTSIVRQTKNPALLDYIGSDLLSLKIFPVPPKGDQKVEVSFTALASKEHNLVEYLYPLKTDRSAASTLEEFRLSLTLKSQEPISSIYSPTHDVVIQRANDHQAVVRYEQSAEMLDRDFQLYYTTSGQDVGLTTLEHRPITGEDGHVMLLISPRAELSSTQKVPRDIVFVIDTSGSMMHDDKMKQAKKAMRHCLGRLTENDRFALVSFSSTIESYRDELVTANSDHISHGKGWIAGLYAGGGTAIDRALKTALSLRSDDADRMFTVVFFTDGQPTIGERDTTKILAEIKQQNTDNTRIFCLGLGNDLNAAFLDQIAEQTRALSSYVRPEQDLEARVANFFEKIHHPVLANLELSVSGDVRLAEVYPPVLPDLFHGDQVVILARCQGAGQATIRLEGKVGPHSAQFEYGVEFQTQADGKPFVEELWARRKVGYLMDQIRINGEQQELVDEVVRLATSFGIATPYTSYLIMPDTPLQLATAASRTAGRFADVPPALTRSSHGGRQNVEGLARELKENSYGLARRRGDFQDEAFDRYAAAADGAISAGGAEGEASQRSFLARIRDAKNLKETLDSARWNFKRQQLYENQQGQLGVDLALSTNRLKTQRRLQATAIRRVASRNCMEFGGVWIDEAFTSKTPTLPVKAQSQAYFQILERYPQVKEVYLLGNHLVWITPSGTGLVIDSADGREKLTSREIDQLFAKR